MDICLALLSYRAPNTLANTLRSWGDSGLLDLCSQRVAFVQEFDADNAAAVVSSGFSVTGSNGNVGIGAAYAALANSSQSGAFLFMEDDWVSSVSTEVVRARMAAAQAAVMFGGADVVKLRHRRSPGEPLYSTCLRGSERAHPSHMLESVHWLDDPDAEFQGEIARVSVAGETYFAASSAHANWTNNPCLVLTDFARDVVAPRAFGDLERGLQGWWEQQDFRVLQGEGIFTHARLDR